MATHTVYNLYELRKIQH